MKLEVDSKKGIARLEHGEIDLMLINENFFEPERLFVTLFVHSGEQRGVVQLSFNELKEAYEALAGHAPAVSFFEDPLGLGGESL